MNALDQGGIARATGWRFAYLVSQAGFSLVLFVCLAQVLPPDQFAQAALAQAVLVIAQALGDFGLSQSAVTALPARLARTPDAAAPLLRGAARAFLMAAGATILLTLIAVAALPQAARLPTLLIGPAAAAAVLVSGADGLLRSCGEFRRPVVLVTLSRAGAFLAVPAAILSDSAAWASAGLSVGAGAASLPALRVLLDAQRGAAEGSARELFRAAVPLGGAQVFIVAAGRLNTVILSTLLSLRAAAAFEGAWRFFQLGQYVAGGLATGAAPFVGHAVGGTDHAGLRRMLWQLIGVLAGAGAAFGALLILLGPWLSEQLLGDLGSEVGKALLPFGLLSPLAFVGFLATTTLAASDPDRVWVLIAYGLGAVVGLCLVFALSATNDLQGATGGCAFGWGIAQVMLIGRLLRFMGRAGDPVSKADALGVVRAAPVERI